MCVLAEDPVQRRLVAVEEHKGESEGTGLFADGRRGPIRRPCHLDIGRRAEYISGVFIGRQAAAERGEKAYLLRKRHGVRPHLFGLLAAKLLKVQR